MAIVLAEVSLQMASGLPRDVAINSTHWLTSGEPNDADFLAITSEIDNFFNLEIDEPGDSEIHEAQLIGLYSSLIIRGENAGHIRFYDAQADPKILLAETDFDLEVATTESALPNELAICLSLTSSPATPVLERRRRGRMYLGPLNGISLGERDESGVDYPAVSSQARKIIAHVAERMASGPTTVRWAIYSRVNDQAYEVSGGFIDNEFDIQRRRGLRATLRTTFSTV